MAIIEPVKQDPNQPSITRKYPIHIRLWHWLNTLVIMGSLVTVLINSTLMDNKATGAIMTEQALKAGQQLTPELSKQIAHELEDNVWNVHAYIGLVLVALLLWRIIYEIISPVSQSLFRKVSIARIALKSGGHEAYLARHELVVKALYIGFYLVLMLMSVTGVLLLFFKHELGLQKPLAHQMQEFHGFCMYLVLLFIGVHIVGVILAERKKSPGIVSDMINGGGK
ncbi:cytochrome b/b6 domain-containing protein [Mucilaginibacter terrae]|uniref:Ni/Fe-hydrogenase 1 B-type cytochrome subunit n=1 Tax=Mucilaginibacter terrae TaxID=1955052 RepID=A0ABU3GPT4_9SPHI|nr:cytochrome b/b6 domain-containing protein [Mucilaginibacter terrae]MDT3400972.1 Ni/Fe-hydrogenase 1 B-type cytochrome subunit [Mucilaginibacter terrae]